MARRTVFEIRGRVGEEVVVVGAQRAGMVRSGGYSEWEVVEGDANGSRGPGYHGVGDGDMRGSVVPDLCKCGTNRLLNSSLMHAD